jgi:hypothetical protein
MDQLQLLFSIELIYQEAMPRALDATGRTGEYLGSGDGTIRGEQISGRVHWDLFEKVEAKGCESNLRGLIQTSDSATIQFDTLGFFRRPAQPEDHIWVNASVVTFHTHDTRYAWLSKVTGTWQGIFDMAAYRHHYQVFIPGGT